MSDKTEHPPVPEAFAALGVRPSILRALAELKYVTPSEIQALLIPRRLAGVDILGQARTGTGKTAAFGIPLLSQCTERAWPRRRSSSSPRASWPCRWMRRSSGSASTRPIRSVAVYGGQKIVAQMKFLKHGPEIIVGTPGRVIDLLDRRIINFDNIRFVVLDEVDRMLDIGFRDDIRNILSRIKGVRRNRQRRRQSRARHRGGARAAAGNGSLTTPTNATPASTGDEPSSSCRGARRTRHRDDATAPPIFANRRRVATHQTMFVSATISDEIERLARQYMREPVEKLIAPGADDKPTVENVEQYYFSVQPWDKYRLLRMLLERENPDLAIVFCRTKRGAEKVAKKLHADGIECREIHGNLAQNKRDRVMKGFRNGKFDVLVATDLASRGIDVADISHIINYDIPEDPEVYVHRVGRTARMGAKGKAFTFVTREQGDELTKVEALINMVVPQATLEGFEPQPPPADWTADKPGFGTDSPGKPTVKPLRSPLRRRRRRSSSAAAPVATGRSRQPTD